MGDSGLAQEFSTFSSRADDLHTREILLVVYSRDCLTTWSIGIHSVGQRPEIYCSLLEEFPKGHGDAVDDEHYLPPADRW